MQSSRDPRVLMSTLWVMLMINMIYNDIFSLVLAHAGLLEMDIPGDPRLMMALAGVLTNVPIVMIFVSRRAPYRLNRRLNIAACVFTFLYIVGGGDTAPHYLVVAAIETLLLMGILVSAVRWEASSAGGHSDPGVLGEAGRISPRRAPASTPR